MNKENDVIYSAKKSLKSHIKFLEGLIQMLNSKEEANQAGAVWTSWVLNRYINKQLVDDVTKAITEHRSIQ